MVTWTPVLSILIYIDLAELDVKVEEKETGGNLIT